MLYGRDCGPKYRVYFHARDHLFGLARKNASIRTELKHKTRTTHRYIVSVRPVPTVPVRCITVDSPSHLFLAGRSMVPTHNSWYARVLMWLLVAHWEYRVRTNEALKKTYRGIRIAFVMPTLAQFKRIGHAQAILSELAPSGEWGFLGAEINRTEWQINFPGGSTVQVVSADSIDNNRGLRRDVIVVDEADDVDIAAFESVLGPWFTEPVSLRQILITGTPRRGRFGLLWKAFRVWPYGDAEHEKLAGAHSFHATGYDCPDIVSRDWLDSERKSISPDRFAREYLCDFDSGEGLVYPFFDPAFHVRSPPRIALFHSFIVGVDYGFNDPSVFLVIGIAGAGRDTVCHVLREWYVIGKSATELAEIAIQINGSFPGAKWYADHDPTNTKTIKDAAHVDIREADKGKVEDGVSFVADAIFIREDNDGRRWSQLYVDPSCRHTIEEFGLYRRKRDPRNSDRVLDDIDTSKNDHCLDAARYALVSRFSGPDRKIWIG